MRSAVTWPPLPCLGGRLGVILARHSPPCGSLARAGSDPRRRAHLGGLGSRAARGSDAVGPLAPPPYRLVPTAAARPWPGHPSPESPPRHAPPHPGEAPGLSHGQAGRPRTAPTSPCHNDLDLRAECTRPCLAEAHFTSNDAPQRQDEASTRGKPPDAHLRVTMNRDGRLTSARRSTTL